MLGSWLALQMQQVARGYLAYKLTDSALALGWVTLSLGLPRIIISPLGGAIADRLNKRDTLLIFQAAMCIMAAFTAWLVGSGRITLDWLLLLGVLQGTAFGLQMPVRQAYLPDVLGPDANLANAIALNNAGMNLMRLVGPAVAGVLIALPSVGVSGVYYVMSACYVYVLWTLHKVPVRGDSLLKKAGSLGRESLRSFALLKGNAPLIALMSLGFIPLAIGMPYVNLMPVFALRTLNIGPQGLGLLLTIAGIGALVGTLIVAYISDRPGKARTQLMLGILFGLALVGFTASAYAHALIPTMAFLVVVGASGDAYMSLNSTLIMLSCAPSEYGRIMGIYMLIQSIRPISILPIAALADAIGAPLTIGIGGLLVACFVFAVARLYPQYSAIG